MKIAIGSDHTGVQLKAVISEFVTRLGYVVVDAGPQEEKPVDYPIYGLKVAEMINNREADLGILICGTGVGISLSANKVKGIRAAVCSEPYSAKMARMHNDANIIAFGARVVGIDLAKMIVQEFLDAQPEDGRHAKRVQLIRDIESKYFK